MLKNDRWQNFNRIVIEGLNECVGSRFFGWAQRRMGIQAQQTQYNEFVENGSKSWTLMGQRLVWKLGMIKQDLRTEPDSPTPLGKGLLIRKYEFPPHPTSLRLTPLVGDLSYYISLPLVHPFPTLVSHTCPYLCARPIGHSFQRSVSCCGSDSTV